jgi:hypothetical protein
MKDKNTARSVVSSLAGSLITALRVFETLNKTYSGALDTAADYQKILVIGMLDGLFAEAPDTALKAGAISEALTESIDKFKEQDPSFVAKMMYELGDRYNKQYEVLTKVAHEQDLSQTMLRTGDKLLGENDLYAMLAAAEKLTNKTMSPGGIHQKIVQGATAVKAVSNVAQSELVSRLFLLGKTIGQNVISRCKTEDGAAAESTALTAMKDAYLIYDYVSNVARKTAKLPSKLLDMGIGACIALATGVIDATIERQEQQAEQKEPDSVLSQSYLEQLKEVNAALKAAVYSVCDDLVEGYKFQKEKLDQLDEKVKTDKGMEKVLAEKPGAKPQDLESLKAFHNRSFGAVKPVVEVVKASAKVVKAGTAAVKGTILSTSFKLGKWIGEKCFAGKGLKVMKTATVSPQTLQAKAASQKDQDRSIKHDNHKRTRRFSRAG